MPAPGFWRSSAELWGAVLSVIRELLTLCAAVSEPLAQSLSPSWYKTDHPWLVSDISSISLTLSFSFTLSFLLSLMIVSVCLIMMDTVKKNVWFYIKDSLDLFLHLSSLFLPTFLSFFIFPLLLFPSSLLLVHLILSVCLPGGVRWSDRACGVQQQRSEDQLHPADLGETPRRPQRGQESPVIMQQSGHIAHRLWVSYRSLIWFHNAGGGV